MSDLSSSKFGVLLFEYLPAGPLERSVCYSRGVALLVPNFAFSILVVFILFFNPSSLFAGFSCRSVFYAWTRIVHLLSASKGHIF